MKALEPDAYKTEYATKGDVIKAKTEISANRDF